MNVKKVTQRQQINLIRSGKKQCNICLTVKDLEQFARAGKNPRQPMCKPCMKKKNDQSKDYQKQYQIENAERIKKQRQSHYKKNAERLKAKAAEWRRSNPEMLKEQRKRFAVDNPSYRAEHRKNNRHLYNAKEAKRRASKRNQTPKNADLELIKLIYKHCPAGYQVDPSAC